jgi:hypothetical protein
LEQQVVSVLTKIEEILPLAVDPVARFEYHYVRTGYTALFGMEEGFIRSTMVEQAGREAGTQAGTCSLAMRLRAHGSTLQVDSEH